MDTGLEFEGGDGDMSLPEVVGDSLQIKSNCCNLSLNGKKKKTATVPL